jgi:hypothetical protein
MVKQYSANPKQPAANADWLIGEGIFMPNIHGKALRSMKDPGTAYDDPTLGKDPQPGTMAGYDVSALVRSHLFQDGLTAQRRAPEVGPHLNRRRAERDCSCSSVNANWIRLCGSSLVFVCFAHTTLHHRQGTAARMQGLAREHVA